MRVSVRRAYTLIEVLVVVTVLGLAAALVVPSMGNTGVLRVQAAVRTVVSDITYAQADAMAFQSGRAILFDADANLYTLCEVRGTVIDPVADRIYDQTFADKRFGDAAIVAANFGGQGRLIFDEMGAPVTTPGGSIPAPNGWIDVRGSDETYRITVEGYTGRVTVSRVEEVGIPGGGAGGESQ